MSSATVVRPAVRPFERWGAVIGWWALSRVISLTAFLGVYLFDVEGRLGPKLLRQPLALLGSWDALWYRRIAQHGYLLIPGRQSDPAFFPLFPMVLRGANDLGIPYTAAGAIASNLAFGVAVVAFYELGRRVVGDVLSRRAACFLALTPMGFVYSMSYPESLALALTMLALLAALDDRWLVAAALAAADGLTRPEAIVLALPLLALAWSRRDRLGPERFGSALAAVLAAPAAVGSFVLYLGWSLGDPNAWGEAEQSWGRAFKLSGPLHAISHLPSKLQAQPLLLRDVLLFLVAALLLVAVARLPISRAWVIAGALVLILPLFSGSFQSEGRFGLFAFPVYWGLAALTRTARAERVVRAGCVVLLVGGVWMVPYLWP